MDYKYIKNIDIKSLNEDITNNEKLIILNFYAKWYKPSFDLNNILSDLGKKYKESIKIYLVNFDRFSDISQRFEVTSLPTLIFIKDRDEKYRLKGTQTKNQVETVIDMIK